MNNSTRVYLPPIHDMLYTLNSESSKNHQDTGTNRKPPSSNSPTLSVSAPYPQVPDSGQSKNKVQGHYRHPHQSYYHSPPQSQHSSDYFQKSPPSAYHQRDSTEYTNLQKTAPTTTSSLIDWQERSADNNRNQNGYTSCSNADQLSATNTTLGNHRPTAAVAEPLQHHHQLQNYYHVQRISHSRSYSDQFMQQNMRRSSASEKILVHSTSPVDPPLPPSSSTSSSSSSRPFHRRTASDVSSFNNRKRRSISNSSSHNSDDQQPQDRRHALPFPSPNKIISANRYKCNECFKTFSRPSSLRIHILSHTGEKPHVCPQPDCGRRFSVQSNMRRHLKVHYCSNPSAQQQQQPHQNLQTFSSRLQSSQL
ncbi:hypothetical protein HMPREF1544_03364 [Mucor circinelloides 1006PhL]|uniref:C2H2-type domain-containing protein n=2 Tax=Mucor TaxID=4830 RepID=S2JMV9_MUCC1|nr:hypothetical protein HMPREF1544_03364 [Mucor circinelloides 1006PhL]KAG1120526.1 hypothetical protein G6F42_012726 [Rhizopus arrhizus]